MASSVDAGHGTLGFHRLPGKVEAGILEVWVCLKCKKKAAFENSGKLAAFSGFWGEASSGRMAAKKLWKPIEDLEYRVRLSDEVGKWFQSYSFDIQLRITL